MGDEGNSVADDDDDDDHGVAEDSEADDANNSTIDVDELQNPDIIIIDDF